MESFALIIFGISGNLAQIKLIPALYDLEEKGLIAKNTNIICIARRDWDKTDFTNYIRDVLKMQNRHHQHDTKPEVVESLLSKMSYLSGDFESGSSELFTKLKKFLDDMGQCCGNHLYYLATYPELYASIFNSLKTNGLNKASGGWVRLMIEKPIGHDLSSAKELDNLLHKYFTEDQIYRLDHYLGKETLQNILVFRFGNGLLRPLMNKDYVDHIQITAAEDFGIGKRGGYYDTVGAFRDVGQNHLLQMLVIATMESPFEFSNRSVTDERIKILKKLVVEPNKIVFGQYKGYLSEEKVNPKSKADTFFALRTGVNTPKWKGVPIYIRAGKMLSKSVTEISIVFKIPENRLFKDKKLSTKPNVLTYRISPNEGIGFEILTKKPGHKLELDTDYMQFCYRNTNNRPPDAYEKLIYDAIQGDPTFFNDSPEVEASWAFVDKLVKIKSKPIVYKPGTWGPKEADDLIKKDGRSWIEPSELLCKL